MFCITASIYLSQAITITSDKCSTNCFFDALMMILSKQLSAEKSLFCKYSGCFSVEASLIYVMYTFVYLLFVDLISRKICLDQALEYILEPGSDSELSGLSDFENEEEPTLQIPSRKQGDQIEDTNSNANASSRD